MLHGDPDRRQRDNECDGSPDPRRSSGFTECYHGEDCAREKGEITRTEVFDAKDDEPEGEGKKGRESPIEHGCSFQTVEGMKIRVLSGFPLEVHLYIISHYNKYGNLLRRLKGGVETL